MRIERWAYLDSWGKWHEWDGGPHPRSKWWLLVELQPCVFVVPL